MIGFCAAEALPELTFSKTPFADCPLTDLHTFCKVT